MQKKGKKVQPSTQQWCEENTAAYRASAPPTRWPTQRANDRDKDHLDGQLTTRAPTLAARVLHR